MPFRQNEAIEDGLSRLKIKTQELDHTSKDMGGEPEERNMKKLWDTMKRPNLQIISIEVGEKFQNSGIDHIFNKILEEKFPRLRKDTHTDTRSTQNPNQTGEENKIPMAYHS